MKSIAIYGFGGFGREIACLLKSINEIGPEWNLIGFFDDGYPIGAQNRYGKVLGGLNELNSWADPLRVVFAIATPHILKKLSSAITNPLISFPNIIAPNVNVFDKNALTIGIGNVISWGGRLSCDVEIGNFNLMNGAASLGHDVKIGNYNVLGPSTRISGECTVGDENFFGIRAIVLQRNKIGNQTRIGANSVIMRNTKDGFLYIGNPAKKMEI